MSLTEISIWCFLAIMSVLSLIALISIVIEERGNRKYAWMYGVLEGEQERKDSIFFNKIEEYRHDFV